MQKTLISWIAFRDDFSEGAVNEGGPNPSIHLHHYDYDRHILLHLNNEESDDRKGLFRTWLSKKGFENRVKFLPVRLAQKDLINLERIQNKLTTILMDYREDSLSFFVTPGTKAMHTAWHIEHLNPGWNSQLIQIRPGRHVANGVPELIQIDFQPQMGALAAIASETELQTPKLKDRIIIAKALSQAYDIADRVALTDKVTTLIWGKSGTGKEEVAKHIWKNSSRKEQKYMAINCSALPDNLLATELFGHTQGGFTDAKMARKGLFRAADGGTVFLDEIGDISPKMQQSLLRVVQERKVQPVGSDETIDVDVRIIAATNKNLLEECSEGRFRWDLYYRLAVVEIQLPQLVEWGIEDLQELIDHLIEQKKELKNGEKLRFTPKARKALHQYHFPGNVRELENLIARLYVLTDGEVSLEHLPKLILNAKKDSPLKLKYVVKNAEKHHIRKIYQQNKFNKERTARVLDISPNTLEKRIKEFNIKKMV